MIAALVVYLGLVLAVGALVAVDSEQNLRQSLPTVLTGPLYLALPVVLVLGTLYILSHFVH